MTRRLSIPLVLAIAATFGGCNCNETQKVQSVVITSPKNGATLTMNVDVDNTKAGLQFEVEAATTNFATDGTAVVKVLVDGKVNGQSTVGTDGKATVVVDSSVLADPNTSHVLSVIAADDVGNAESAKISVIINSAEIPCVVSINAPLNGDVLSTKADVDAAKAGIQTMVSIHTEGCTGGKVVVCMQAAGLTGTACKGNVGIAVAEASLDPTNTTLIKTDWVEGAVVVIAEHDGAAVTDSDPSILVHVDAKAPTCQFVAPTDKAILDTLNFDVQLMVTGAEEGQPVSLTSNLKPEAMSGTTSATGEVTIAAILPLGQQTLTAKVTDQAGNEGTCAITVTVDIEGCDVVLTDPATGKFLFNIANSSPGGSPLLGKYTIRGQTTRCKGGVARFTKTVNGGDSDLGTADVDATTGAFSRMLFFPDGEADAQLHVKIEKVGVAPNDGVFFDYSTDFTAPACTFVSPVDGAIVTSQAVDVVLTVTGAEAGQAITLTSSGKPGAMTGTVPATGNATIAANLPLGAQTLTASVTDQAKNSGTCAIDVSVNVEGCDIVLSDPATPELIVNIANGSPTGTPLEGTYTIKGSTTRCAGGTVTFVKDVGGTQSAPETATVAADGTFSHQMKFKDGEVLAAINVKVDKVGNAPNAGVDIAYFSDFTAPTLDATVPAIGNMYVVPASNPHLIAGEAGYVLDENAAAAGGQVTASVTASGVGTVAASGFGSALEGSVVVKVGTATQISEPFSNNAVQTVSGLLAMTEGYSGGVYITLTDSAGNVTTAQWDARVATQPLPATLTISTPTAGTINVFKDRGGDRQTYGLVQGIVTYSATAPLGMEIVLCSTAQYGTARPGCQTGMYEVPGTRTGATGTGQIYSAVPLAQGEQDLVAQMTDAVGTSVSSAAVHLMVDTVPPVVTKVVATNDTDGSGTISSNELAPNQNATFRATIPAADAEGRQASFTTTDSTGKIATVFATVTAGVADFVVAGIPDGTFTGKVALTDASGNPNASTSVSPAIVNATASISLTFQRVAPSISVVAPNFVVCNQAKQKQPPSGPNVCDVDFTVSVGASTTQVDFSLSPTSAGTFPAGSVTTFTNGKATKTYTLNQNTAPVTMIARAYDASGNYRDASWTFTLIDTIAPYVTITAPANNSIQFTQRFPFSVETDAEVGQTVSVTSSANGQVVGSGLVVAGAPNTATFDVNVPGSNQTLTATVNDLAGNTSPAQSVDVQMNLAGCDVNFINPASANPIFNLANAPGGLVHITGNSTRLGCESTKINFTAAINGAAAIPVGSATATNGNFMFDYTFPDGSTVLFEGASTAVGSTANGFTAITDITPPTLVINAPVPNASKALFLVAKTGNVNVKAGMAGYVPEIDDTVADGQVVFDLLATGAGASANTGTGTVEILQGTNSVYSNVSASNAAQALAPTVTLDQAFVGNLFVRATDYAGNSALATWDLTVDVVPPPAPAIITNPSAAFYAHVVNERHADIDIYWATPVDEGPVSQVLTWDFGYSSTTRLAGAAFDEAAFDNAGITLKISMPVVAPIGEANGLSLMALPPLNKYYFAPRMVDGVGNRSPMSAFEANCMWHSTSFGFPLSGSTAAGFGSVIATGGDVNGDAKPDFLVGGPTAANGALANAGSVTLVLGGSVPPVISQTIQGDAGNQQFGAVLAMADVNKDGRADALAYAGGKVRVHVAQASAPYFLSTPSFTIVGPTSIAGIAVIPDFSGDGYSEIAVGCRGVNSNTGAVYLFKAKTDLEWSPLVVAGNVDAASAADIVISGSDAGGMFGYSTALVGADLDGDQYGDLVVPAVAAKKIYLFKGASLRTAAPAISAADAYQVLAFSGPNTFPYSAAAVDVTGDGRSDLLAGDPGAASLYLFAQESTGVFLGAEPGVPWANGSSSFSRPLVAADISGDGLKDVLVGGAPSGPGRVSLFYSSPAGVSATAGALVDGVTGFGKGLGATDINSDGMTDLIVGDTLGNGNVTIYY